MLDPDLLDILVCPETKEAVRLADSEVLERVNASIADGELRNRGGEEVHQPLEAGLLRADGQLLFPVRDGIPVMLLDEAIPLDT